MLAPERVFQFSAWPLLFVSPLYFMRRQQGNFSLLDCHGNKRLWLELPTIRHLPLAQNKGTHSWVTLERSSSSGGWAMLFGIFVIPPCLHIAKYFLLLHLLAVFGNEARGTTASLWFWPLYRASVPLRYAGVCLSAVTSHLSHCCHTSTSSQFQQAHLAVKHALKASDQACCDRC